MKSYFYEITWWEIKQKKCKRDGRTPPPNVFVGDPNLSLFFVNEVATLLLLLKLERTFVPVRPQIVKTHHHSP